MRQSAFLLSALGAALLLAGCSRSHSTDAVDATGNGVLPPGVLPQTRYDLANGCYALKSVSGKTYAVHGADGSYAATSPGVAGAEGFFMKPTALGPANGGENYLFYAKDKTFLAANGASVGSAAAPADAADWTINTDPQGNYTVYSASAGKALAVAADSGKLILADAASAGDAAKFGFDPAKGCSDFPEAQVNASGPGFKGEGVDKPVLGFADVHQHVSATTFLGGAHYGSPFHRFGITEALKNCEVAHGPDGHKDLLGNLYSTSPLATHNTVGWPTFIDWPAAHSLTHESTYYKWIERAWKAGLRVLMNNLVENQTLCQLEIVANGAPQQDCNEMDSAEKQAGFMHDLQDYVDAQEGGPGKGWFRIVDNPADARKVINDGKLAVVLGIEISHLFNCDVKQVAGLTDVNGCTTAVIDTQFDRLYKLGVREMFPVHEFDNALGGNGIFDGLVLNVGNFADTGKFWATYDCPSTDTTGNFGDYLYSPGAIMTTSDPSGASNPVVDALLAGRNIPLPIYPHTRQCNARGLTDLGKYAFKKMMDHRIIMEVDHLELSIKEDLIKLAEQQTPPYPLISSHGGHGGISKDQATRIYKLGGVIYPGGGGGNGANFYDFIKQLLPLKSADHLFGVGIGSDTNGLASQPGPSGSKTPVQYPFTLFKGANWGPQFARIAPISFDHEVSGQRVYDINIDGRAHYGLDADWVEEVRLGAISETLKNNAAHPDQPQLDPQEQAQLALTSLYNSAEAYLRLWEQTLNR
jgi:microsomal dipeptidase-like Zn-dependent dipeptidase